MPLSWNEIRDRATAFSHEWADEAYERGEAQTFWNEFFQVFGLTRRRVASFEAHVKKLGDKGASGSGFIDCFWPGMLIAEHKSLGKDLDSAYVQAMGYFDTLKERDLPRYVVVSDFATIRLYDLDDDTQAEFALGELPKQIKRFGFIAGYRPQQLRAEDPVNVKAAERMGKLHDALRESGYDGHKLELLLVRLLFCLFADDTGIFQPAQAFRLWLEEQTAEDGSDLGSKLAHAFQVLDTPHDKRWSSLNEQLAAFPYVNGRLFEEMLPIAAFNTKMRDALLDACALDWSQISPAVFGAMFQSIMEADARRNLGAHYTSEQNIEKLIKPLFLDELRAEFERVKHNRNKLFEFHKKLRTLTFFDPACGCGNFLVVTYRALRELELDVLRASHRSGQLTLDVHGLINLDVDQFYGIEIEEFPARIAEVALWLTDHQMNVKVSEEFGMYFARIPLRSKPHIHHGNALRVDWEDVIPKERLSYILGNPPFVGHQYRSGEQAREMTEIWGTDGKFGKLDYVSCWYKRAIEFARENRSIRLAFVSTNSVSQGESVSVMWPPLLQLGVEILFAHRTFQWWSEGRGKAAVHCVIIGLGFDTGTTKKIFDYESPRAEPQEINATHINAYLVDAVDAYLPSRSKTPTGIPKLTKGSQPTDGGNLLLTPKEREEILQVEPDCEPWIKRFIGARELIHDVERYCLWLIDCPPFQLRGLPKVTERLAKIKALRSESKTASVRADADTPALFTQIRQPASDYLAVPRHSSERRQFIPIAYFSPDVIAGDAILVSQWGDLFRFGIMMSTMHNAWVRAVAGRIKSDLRYEASVYNNFPWPQDVSDTKHQAIDTAAQGILDAREQFPGATLADLYDPLTMPPALLKAHRKLDRAVDAAYSRRKFTGDADRVAFLFEQYEKLTSESSDA